MTRTIPSLKARPEWIPRALQCIQEHTGNFGDMENCIVSHWRNTSQRTKPPSSRNALRAVFGPTLRHLQLIMGEGDEIKLMSKGKKLLKAYERQGEAGFKRILAKTAAIGREEILTSIVMSTYSTSWRSRPTGAGPAAAESPNRLLYHS